MSKKVFQSRVHRERAQPANRTRLGILEKHKDYVLRARNFHAKKARLLALRRQASAKNPDEFYFAMQSARKNKQGEAIREAEFQKMPAEVIKLLKSQDLAYVQEMIRKESKKLEHLRMEPKQVAKDGRDRGHVKFIENDDDLADLIVGSGERMEDEKGPSSAVKPGASGPRPSEYEARCERMRLLKITERKLSVQNVAMSRGRKRKVGQDEHGIPVFKWDQERKK